MLLILAEKRDQKIDYVNALKGDQGANNLNRYVAQVKNSPVLPDYPDIRVAYLQGHLYELYEPSEYNEKWEKWDLNTLPIFPEKMKMHLKKGFGKRRQDIAEQVAECDDLWLASDSDVEGENLGYIFLSHNHGLSKLNGRVWQNSQSKPSLVRAFHHIRDPKETIGNAHSGYSRMLADWYIGMNYSRLMSILLHDKGYQGVFSVGRVQTPTLHLINERRKEREKFQNNSVYEISAVDQQGLKFSTDKAKAFDTEDEAKQFIQSIQDNQLSITDTQKQAKSQPSPKLYKTGKVQSYLVRKCHITAKSALNDVLEYMYNTLNIISYPRTDCDLLTKDDYNELKSHLSQYAECYEGITGESIKPYLTNTEPNEKHVDFSGKKVQKVGHHALTTDQPITFDEYKKLKPNQQVAYRYILESVLAMFMPNYEYNDYEVQAQNQLDFHAHYNEALNQDNWKMIYPSKEDESENNQAGLDMSIYQKGQPVDVDHYEPKEIKAKPPKAITESNLVGAVMPQYHLGTQATRGDIIESLTSRKIITIAKKADKSKHQVKGEFIPTDKGVILLEAMRDTNLLDLSQVQSWEDRMTAIAQGDEQVAGFLKGIKESIYQDIQKLPQEDLKLSIAPSEKPSEIKDKQIDTLDIKCPKCKKGNLQHLTMTKDKKPLDFYSCDNEKCKFMASSHFAGIQITPEVLKSIIEGTFPERKFQSKKGNKFQGKLVYSKGKIQFQFDDKEPMGDDTGITCPKCQKGTLELIHYQKQGKQKGLYVCTDDQCKFAVPDQFAGLHITPDILQSIIDGTFSERNFKSKKGNTFAAKLVYEKGKIQLKFDDSKTPQGVDTKVSCPECKQGHLKIIDYKKQGKKKSGYVCSNSKCQFFAPGQFAGIALSPDILESIIMGSFTKQTFVSKRTHSKYQARLVYQDGKIQMNFD